MSQEPVIKAVEQEYPSPREALDLKEGEEEAVTSTGRQSMTREDHRTRAARFVLLDHPYNFGGNGD